MVTKIKDQRHYNIFRALVSALIQTCNKLATATVSFQNCNSLQKFAKSCYKLFVFNTLAVTTKGIVGVTYCHIRTYDETYNLHRGDGG